MTQFNLARQKYWNLNDFRLFFSRCLAGCKSEIVTETGIRHKREHQFETMAPSDNKTTNAMSTMEKCTKTEEKNIDTGTEKPEEKRPAEEITTGSANNTSNTTNGISTSCTASNKKAKVTPPSSTEKENPPPTTKIYDLAKTMGLHTGDRLEVQWDVSDLEKGEDGHSTRWWGCTLLEHDGRTASPDEEDDEEQERGQGTEKDNQGDDDDENAKIAVRTLDYDPYVEGGFPHRSKEDVMFVNNNTIVSVDDGVELSFRKEGEEEVFGIASSAGGGGQTDGIEHILNGICENAIKSAKSKGNDLQKLSAAQQALVADRMAKSKEKLMTALLTHVENKDDKTVTAQDIPTILAEAFGN